MATRRYGISRGERFNQVTEAVGSATAADNLEVTIDLAANMTQEEFFRGLELIKDHVIRTNKWPPA